MKHYNISPTKYSVFLFLFFIGMRYKNFNKYAKVGNKSFYSSKDLGVFLNSFHDHLTIFVTIQA